ncbi:MAG: folate-binding protein YgfZ [Chloroflexi bacterium]|nr:folate-binding protein YgfZ [Chloroflexota bacterium]
MTPVSQTMNDVFSQAGAALAGDGIPLHFGDQAGEVDAGLNAAILMDRSHEGRLRLEGRDRLALPHRISTNAVETLAPGAAAPTIFTNPNARIIDRVTLCNLGETALMLTEPGRGDAVAGHLRRNIFFNDDLRVSDARPGTRQFVLIGPQAAAVATKLGLNLEPLHGVETDLKGTAATVLRDKPFGGDPRLDPWRFILREEDAVQAWAALIEAGGDVGLRPAGSLAYHALRVLSGRPGINAELSTEYIPLEVGLWDEISFTKGCYVGQEIIARMESRGRLARTIVRVRMDTPVTTPAVLRSDGREVGRLTSAVQLRQGEVVGIAVVKLALATPGSTLMTDSGASVAILDRAGSQPELDAET